MAASCVTLALHLCLTKVLRTRPVYHCRLPVPFCSAEAAMGSDTVTGLSMEGFASASGALLANFVGYCQMVSARLEGAPGANNTLPTRREHMLNGRLVFQTFADCAGSWGISVWSCTRAAPANEYRHIQPSHSLVGRRDLTLH